MSYKFLSDGTLDLDHVQQKPIGTADGFESATLKKGNAGLANVFQQTEAEYPESPHARLYRCMASVRWFVRNAVRKDYSKQTGIDPRSVASLETNWTGERRNGRMVMETMLSHWKKVNVPHPIREQLLDLLLEIDGGVNGFYRMMCYDVGSDTFAERTELKVRTLENRRRIDVVPEFSELLAAVRAAYPGRSAARPKRIEQAKEFWAADMQAKHEERTVEPPLARFLTLLEIRFAEHGENLTFEALRDLCNFKTHQARDLQRCELVPWELVDHVAQELLEPDEYKTLSTEWKRCYLERQKQPTFEKTFLRTQKTQGITDYDIRYALAGNSRQYTVKATNKKGTALITKNSILAMLRDGYCTEAPARSCIAAIARDEKEEQQLITLFRADKERQYRRTGTNMHGVGLEMRIDRDLNAVTREQAVDYCIERGWYDETRRAELLKNMQHIENAYMDTKGQSVMINRFRRAIDAVGNERRAVTLQRKKQPNGTRLPEHCASFTTVHDAIRQIGDAVGAMEAVWRHSTEECDDNLRIGRTHLRDIAHGKKYPSLPQIQNVLQTYGLRMTEPALYDWYAVYPVHLCVKFEHLRDRTLDRMIQTMIAAVEPSMADFTRNRMPHKDSSEYFVTNVLTSLHRDQHHAAWSQLEDILLALHLTPKDLQWRLAYELYHNGDDAQAAIAAVQPKNPKKRIPMNNVNFPGFTLEELGQFHREVPYLG